MIQRKCHFYPWSATHSFIQQINFSSMVNVIGWSNVIYKIHYHYGKTSTDFHTNDLAAEPVKKLIKYDLSIF